MNNIDKQYQNLLKDILENGYEKSDRTGTGTLSVFGRQIKHKMSEGFPLLTTKKMYTKGIITELIWFLRGNTNIKYLIENNCHIWDGDAWANYSKKVIANNLHLMLASNLPVTKEEFISRVQSDEEFKNQWGELGPVYGKQWRDWGGRSEIVLTNERDENGYLKYKKVHHNGIDQIKNSIELLKKDPDSRRNIVSAWNVGEMGEMVLPPCHNFFQFYTRELTKSERAGIQIKTNDYQSYYTDDEMDKNNIPKRAISLMWNQRSVDTFLGLPFNIASYAFLLEIVAKIVNMVPDELIGTLGDTHLYLNHIDQAKTQIERDPYELPSFKFSDKFLEIVDKYNGTFTSKLTGNTPDYGYYKEINSVFNSLTQSDFILSDYNSHPTIKGELSN
jgi:thymidylate synthase